jgi:hypothetical protein
MSYMRAPVYAWSDAKRIHLWAADDSADACPFDARGYEPWYTGGVEMKHELFDALALMRVAELLAPGNAKALKRGVKRARKERGNAGTYDLFVALGEDPEAAFAAQIKGAAA